MAGDSLPHKEGININLSECEGWWPCLLSTPSLLSDGPSSVSSGKRAMEKFSAIDLLAASALSRKV